MAESNIQLIIDTFQGVGQNALLLSFAVFIVAFVLSKTITFLLTSLSEKLGRYRLHINILIPVLKVFIYLSAGYHILVSVFGFSFTQFIIFLTLIGAVIGFGLRSLFEDLAAGIVITIEKPYQVGDRIEIGEYYGEVQDIGMRSTRLITPSDNLVSAPNGLIFEKCVASGNSGSPEMMTPLDIYIDNRSSTEMAMNILREAVVTSRYVYISPSRPVIILLKDYPFYKRIRAKAYVNDLRDEFVFRSDVTKRTWDEFYKNGIKAPDVVFMGHVKE